MKRYYKNGKEIKFPEKFINSKKFPINEKVLKMLGYEIKEDVEEVIFKSEEQILNNDIIKIKRANAYAIRADKYLIAYQAYKELGDIEKALEMKKLWLSEREKINKEFPYITEDVKTDVKQSKTE